MRTPSFDTDDDSTRELPFVGRREALADAYAPKPQALLTFGEAGVGKTRFLAEIARRHLQAWPGRSVTIVVHEADLRDPLEPLRELCACVARGVDLDRSLEAHVANGEDRFTARFARELLAAATSNGSLFLQIDDVHRATHATLSSFAYLIERLQDAPIRWHFASRESVDVVAAFETAERLRLLRVQRLPLFSVGETADFLRSRSAFESAEETARIHLRSGGNPLFVELLIGTRPTDTRNLRATIDERLYALGESGRALALWIATGERPTLERTALAARVSLAWARAALDELVESGIVSATGDTRSIVFRHDLLREATLNRALESDRRTCFDGWLAYAADGRERLRCLEGAGRWSDLVGELLREGWNQAELGRSADSCQLASRALEIARRDDVRRYEAYALAARGDIGAGRFDEAGANFTRFLSGTHLISFPVLAFAYGRYAVAAAPEFGGSALPELDDLWRRSRDEASAAYPMLGHALALVRYRGGDVAGALDVVRRTRELPAIPVERLRQDIWEDYLAGQLDDGCDPSTIRRAVERLTNAVDRAEALGATTDAARACFMLAFVLHRSGDLISAQRWCRRGLAQPEPKPRGVVAALRSQLCEYLILEGRAWEALGLLLETLEDTRTLTSDARANVSALLAFTQALTGSIGAARRTIEPLVIDDLAPVIRNAVETIRGYIAEISSDVREATRAYETVIAHATPAETSLVYALSGRARLAFSASDVVTLDALLGRIARERPRSSLLRVEEQIEAFRAIVRGDGAASARLLVAVDGLQSAFDAAATRVVLGERTGDRTSLSSASDRFSDMGTAPLVDRARAAARAFGFRLGAPRRTVLTLSERDRAVAMGVAAGLTNAEIASELHLSSRTVEKYVSGLLHRFDLRSRVDLAALVASGGLANV